MSRMLGAAIFVVLLLGSGCAHKAESKKWPLPAQAAQEPQVVTNPAPAGTGPKASSAKRALIPPGDSLEGSVHVVLGIPTDGDPSDDYLLDRRYWVASYNPRRLVPNWVAWRLVAADLGNQARSNHFAADTWLPSAIHIVRPTDYVHSGYDRGHMCPSADRTSSHDANQATFLMTNIQPQVHGLNAGPWESLERYERALAEGGKQVEIVAGGIFTTSTASIGAGISVPTANFKIVVVMEPGQAAADVTVSTPVYAVIMPNKPEVAGTRWTTYLVSVDEVERETGYDFLSEVPDDVENEIEARVAIPPPR